MISIILSKSHTAARLWASLAPALRCALIWKTGNAVTSQDLSRFQLQSPPGLQASVTLTHLLQVSAARLSATLNNSKPCFHFQINTALSPKGMPNLHECLR